MFCQQPLLSLCPDQRPPTGCTGKTASIAFLHMHVFPAGQQQQSCSWPRKDDPVLEHLLRDFRSAKLRKQFFSHDPKDYSETLDVKVLVRRAAGPTAEAATAGSSGCGST